MKDVDKTSCDGDEEGLDKIGEKQAGILLWSCCSRPPNSSHLLSGGSCEKGIQQFHKNDISLMKKGDESILRDRCYVLSFLKMHIDEASAAAVPPQPSD